MGDSRVYLIRNKRAIQLTSDETYVQLMVDVGVIQPDDVPQHPMRNVVLNAVGTRSSEGNPVVHSKLLLPGDVVLLTTDGVSDHLREPTLTQILDEHSDPAEAATAIVRAALDAGSRDNASCVTVMIERAEDSEHANHDDLHFELQKLHEMLTDVDSVDEELRSDMVQIAGDIRKALHQEETDELASLGKQLKQRAIKFEVGHLQLTNTVASIVDLLARMGI